MFNGSRPDLLCQQWPGLLSYPLAINCLCVNYVLILSIPSYFYFICNLFYIKQKLLNEVTFWDRTIIYTLHYVLFYELCYNNPPTAWRKIIVWWVGVNLKSEMGFNVLIWFRREDTRCYNTLVIICPYFNIANKCLP